MICLSFVLALLLKALELTVLWQGRPAVQRTCKTGSKPRVCDQLVACCLPFLPFVPYLVVVVVLLSVVNEETALVSLPHKAAA